MNKNFEILFLKVEIEPNSERPDGFSYESTTTTCESFIYSLTMNFTSWGISSSHFDSHKQELFMNVELQPDDSDDPVNCYFKVKTDKISFEDHNILLKKYDICPSHLVVHLKDIVKSDELINGKMVFKCSSSVEAMF